MALVCWLPVTATVSVTVVSALGRFLGAWSKQRSPARGAAAWVLAVAGPALLTLGSVPFRSSLGLNGFLFCTLLIVIAVAVVGGLRPALTAVVVGGLAGAAFLAPPYGSLRVNRLGDVVGLVTFAVVGVALAVLVDELARLAEEQAALRRVEAALRRVATLVARGLPAQELFAAVTEEVGQLLDLDHAHLGRYESDGTVTIVADWSSVREPFSVGVRWSLVGENLCSLVAQTGRPARIDSYPDASGALAVATAERGIRSGVGAPIVVEAITGV